MARISPYFPLSHGIVTRVDDRCVSVVSSMAYDEKTYRLILVHIKRTIIASFARAGLDVSDFIFLALGKEGPKPQHIMIDAAHLKAHRTAASLLKKGCSPPYWAHKK